jgi:hypothetical protein
VNPEERLAAIAAVLEGGGLPFLVMGGHAVRFYGLRRDTADFDLHLSLDRWDHLFDVLRQASLFAGQLVDEGPSWRREAFRRFQIGTLPSGAPEWLEVWRFNHLLPPFPELYGRREQGLYGGRLLPFLSLPDLIRSKETQRARDWDDVRYLEEVFDSRNLAQATAPAAALCQLRSRRGFEQVLLSHPDWLADQHLVSQAVAQARSPMTLAILLPYAPAVDFPVPSGLLGEVLAGPARRVPAGSGKHLAIIEVIRRLYQQAAIAADKADKQAVLKANEQSASDSQN